MIPAWLLDIFVAIVLAVAVLCVARVTAARPWRRGAVVTETDIAYPLMAIAMAGTLASSLRVLPNGAWAVVFAVLTAWFAYRAVQDVRASGVGALAGLPGAPQRVQSAAMLYMFLALSAPAAGSGAGAGGSAAQMLNHATLAFVFAFVLAACSVWDLDQLSGVRYSLAGAGAALTDATQPGSLGQTAAASAATVLPGCLAADDQVITRARPRSAEAEQAVPDHDDTFGNTIGAARGFLLSPEVTVGCRVAMGVTMSFMLLIMI